MSLTPPRKGKKRLQPQTPTGKPPAKASHPSSPDYTAWMESQISPKPTPKSSAPPAIPSFQPASGSTRTPPTPTRASTVDPMVEDPRAPTPDPDPLAFTTVDTELDDEEAASSFKELLDWMRYLAQHQGQRDCLHDLLTMAASSLRDLMGSGSCEKPATYAAVATSAPQPK